MVTDDRMERAGNYVLGLLNDGERERAERDLEVDASFREAVVEVAERMYVFDRAVDAVTSPEKRWREIAVSIAELPHMRPAQAERPAAQPEKPANFGRRRTDAKPAAGTTSPAMPIFLRPPPQSARHWSIAVIVCGLIAAFGLGYLTGLASMAPSPQIAVKQP